MLGRMVDVHLVEHQAGGLGFFVMAGDAILIHQCVLRRWLLRPKRTTRLETSRLSEQSHGTNAPSVRYIAFDTERQPEG